MPNLNRRFLYLSCAVMAIAVTVLSASALHLHRRAQSLEVTCATTAAARDQSMAEAAQLRNALDSLEAAHAQLRAQAEESAAHVETLQHQVAHFQRKAEANAAARDDALAAQEQLQLRISALRAEMLALQSQPLQLQAALENAHAETEALRSELNQLATRNALLPPWTAELAEASPNKRILALRPADWQPKELPCALLLAHANLPPLRIDAYRIVDGTLLARVPSPPNDTSTLVNGRNYLILPIYE